MNRFGLGPPPQKQLTGFYREFLATYQQLHPLHRFAAGELAQLALQIEEDSPLSYDDRERLMGWLTRFLPLLAGELAATLLGFMNGFLFVAIIGPEILALLAQAIAESMRVPPAAGFLIFVLLIMQLVALVTMMSEVIIAILDSRRRRRYAQELLAYYQAHRVYARHDLDLLTRRQKVIRHVLRRRDLAPLRPLTRSQPR